MPLGDSPDPAVEVKVLLSGEQVVQRVHLGTVADVDALLAALNNVHQAPGEREGERQGELLHRRPPEKPAFLPPTKYSCNQGGDSSQPQSQSYSNPG